MDPRPLYIRRTAQGLCRFTAKRLRKHYSQIGRYERDEAGPSADVLKKLANELA